MTRNQQREAINNKQRLFQSLYNGEAPGYNALTYAQIGAMFGFSRQRVHQIMKGYVSPRNKQGIEQTTSG